MADSLRDPVRLRSSLGKLAGVVVLVFLAMTPSLTGTGQDKDPPAPSDKPKPDETRPEAAATVRSTSKTSPIKLAISGPKNGTLDNVFKVEITATNSSDATVENIILKALLDPNLELDSGRNVEQLVVGTLKAGESRVIPLTLVAANPGKLRIHVGVDPAPALLNLTEFVVQVRGDQPNVAPNIDALGVPVAQPAPPGVPGSPVQIDPKTPVEKLLPKAPRSRQSVLVDKVSQVTEVAFEETPPKNVNSGVALQQIRMQIAGINHVNKQKKDAFMVALIKARSDLQGLPFVMGDDCRQKPEHARLFFHALTALRGQMQQNFSVPVTEADQAPQRAAEFFWDNYQATCTQIDRTNRPAAGQQEATIGARIGTLMQVCGPQSANMRKGLVKYLAGTSHAEATRALARLAVYSEEDDLRQAAVEALKVRREKDYTPILTQALRYPLPAVAQHAADAIARLQRTDLASELVAVLDEADPRAPQAKEVDGKKVTVVRELVKINHHRNCLMCHAPGIQNGGMPNGGPMGSSVVIEEALGEQPLPQLRQIRQVAQPGGQPTPPPPAARPGDTDDINVAPDVVTGAVPVPGTPLPSLSNGYNNSIPDILVRVDVTYLRQDFSLMLPVADAGPWPEQQRFDFLVRTRQVNNKEAGEFRDTLAKAGTSPYRQAAHRALRELTNLDAEPTADAWRRTLKR